MNSIFTVQPKEFSRVAVVGDIHGDYKTLIALPGLVDFGVDLLVFLGDYADRGLFGVETIRAIMTLKEKFPKHIVTLKGNHEDFTEDGKPIFEPCTIIAEAEKKTGSWKRFFKDEFKPFIDNLHLTALVPENALLVHGGISSKLTQTSDLSAPSRELELDLLWSDPFNGTGERPNPRGLGVQFGEDISTSKCMTLGVKRIIRSHQPNLASYAPALGHANRVITIQATSVYGGQPFIFFLEPVSTVRDYYTPIK